MRNFQDLDVWKEAHDLTLMIYTLSDDFPESERFGITSQIRRAAASIPTNIAEGCGRNSQKEMIRFIDIALGSAKETEYLILLCRDLNVIRQEHYDELTQRVIRTIRMGIGLRKSITSRYGNTFEDTSAYSTDLEPDNTP